FIPWLRYHAITFHRVNGYIILLLLLISNIGALMIARHSFGGEIETQVAVGVLAILTTGSAALAYINIRYLQIDQHRAWMLRTAFYAGTIITVRVIMIISALIISNLGGFYQATKCDKIAYIFADDEAGFREKFPACFAVNGTSDGWIAVEAILGNSAANVGAALGLGFGTAIWLALVMHGIGVEVYLALTPREGNRLRYVSYQRQLQAGYRYPGSAGLTADRLGDADVWKPASQCSDG
ncbi:MAG: hypothetical protein Q9183_005311, partial [Haloplaca sp. 2 TL-2023]